MIDLVNRHIVNRERDSMQTGEEVNNFTAKLQNLYVFYYG